MKANDNPLVGLISMPWMAANMPSIQLAVLAAALQQEGIASEVHEFYLDYAACIGLNVYNTLCVGGGMIEEWLFAQHYFESEMGNALTEFRVQRQRFRLRFRLESAELEEQVLDALIPVTANFLEEIVAMTDWSHYDIIGFSLTHSQIASSMALARLIKKRHPEIIIVFGGAACAGPMGSAILRICPYIDVVVRVEGEAIFPELVRRICRSQNINDLSGVSWRTSEGEVIANPGGLLDTAYRNRPSLCFDAYFDRLERLGLRDKVNVWLLFESSRGCWYGEKVQCTFCGLHEFMKYRNSSWQTVLAELEYWHHRYGINRFFAVDLIMPRDFFNTFLPEIVRREHSWSIFYDIKANLKRSEIEILAAAGVHWIQPGIESLDHEVLKLMKKGVSPLQNIQLLKWCEEMDIYVSWNIIYGFPGESPSAYTRMAERMRLLFHLMPPTGGGLFQLHRFSPYFDHPEAFGIRKLGPHPLYEYIFPVSTAELEDLAYFHLYSTENSDSVRAYIQPILRAIQEWRAARARGASLTFHLYADGTAEILDTRTLPETTYYLTPSEARLYLFLDAATVEKKLADTFSRTYPIEAQVLAENGGIDTVIDYWRQQGLVISDHGHILAIAVNAPEVAKYGQMSSTEVSILMSHSPKMRCGAIRG